MEDTPKAVHSEAYILVPHTVEDLDDFVENPDKYLVDMYEAPERAADIWRNRLKRNPYGGEGLLQVAYYGIDLISASLWDNVASLWMDLVEVIDSFLQTGEGEGLFPGSPVPIHLRSKGRSTLFTVDEQTNVVDPKDFIPGCWMKPSATSNGFRRISALTSPVTLGQSTKFATCSLNGLLVTRRLVH